MDALITRVRDELADRTQVATVLAEGMRDTLRTFDAVYDTRPMHVKLGDELAERDEEISAIEARLSIAKAERKRLAENALPEAMQSAEIETFVTSSGRAVSLVVETHPSLAQKATREFATWAAENDALDIVKLVVEIEFPKGQFKIAQRFVEGAKNTLHNVYLDHDLAIERQAEAAVGNAKRTIRARKIKDADRAAIEPRYTVLDATLKAWARKRADEGKPFPEMVKVYAPLVAKLGKAPVPVDAAGNADPLGVSDPWDAPAANVSVPATSGRPSRLLADGMADYGS